MENPIILVAVGFAVIGLGCHLAREVYDWLLEETKPNRVAPNFQTQEELLIMLNRITAIASRESKNFARYRNICFIIALIAAVLVAITNL